MNESTDFIDLGVASEQTMGNPLEVNFPDSNCMPPNALFRDDFSQCP